MSDFLPPVVLRLAADISEYTEKLALASAQLDEFTSRAGEHLESATRTIGEEGRGAGERYSEGLSAHAVEGAEKVVRDATGRLRDGRGRFVSEGEEHGKGMAQGFLRMLMSGLGDAWSAVSQAASKLGSALGSAASVAGSALSFLSAIAFPALIAAALQTLPAIGAVAGALAASIPAAASVAAGALGTVMLGFHGIAGAISAVFAPAAGGAVAATNQVANAEWNLKQAQQQVIQTQLALNQARVAAVQNIKDLALAMSGAKLHVEEAELAVKDADAAWRAAFATGNQDQIMRTNLALRQAQQNLAEAQNSSDKTAAQKADADARGVEGSQQVQSALQAQANAVHALEQAQQALTQAQHAGGGAASALATALAKLAPNARAFVMEIMHLKPELQGLQQMVQQHMFAGLATDLDQLAHAWLPGATAGMRGMADQFNLLFHGIMQGLASPAFTGALSGAFGSFTKVLHEFAALAPTGVAAFGHLISAATPFLQKLGEAGAGGLGKFLDWINKISANGELAKFFNIAGQAMSAFGGFLKDIGSIFLSVFQAINGSGGTALGVLGTLVHSIAEFLSSAEGMKMLSGLFAALNPALNLLGSVLAAVLPVLGALIGKLGPVLGSVLTTLAPILVNLISAVMPLASAIGDALMPVVAALAPVLGDIIKAATPLIQMLGGALGEVIKAMAPIVVTLATVISQILVQALDALHPVFEKLLPVIVQLVQAILPPLVPIIQLIGRLFAALMPILTPLISLLVDILTPILKLLEPVIAALTPVIQLVADALVAVITPIADFIGWLVAALDKASTWKAVGKWFTDLWHTISDAFMAGVHWVADKWNEFIADIKAIPKRIVEGLGNLRSMLIEKGKDVVFGLWDGIQSLGGWLANKVIGWAKDAIPGPIAHALGIASPSKVAANLARWVPIGLAQGLDETTGHVVAASGRLADAMLPTVNGTPVNIGVTSASGGGGGPAFHSEPSSASLPPIHLTIPVQIGGRTMETVHVELIPVAQRYKARTGTTGLS